MVTNTQNATIAPYNTARMVTNLRWIDVRSVENNQETESEGFLILQSDAIKKHMLSETHTCTIGHIRTNSCFRLLRENKDIKKEQYEFLEKLLYNEADPKLDVSCFSMMMRYNPYLSEKVYFDTRDRLSDYFEFDIPNDERHRYCDRRIQLEYDVLILSVDELKVLEALKAVYPTRMKPGATLMYVGR